MLSEEEVTAIMAEAAHYEELRALCVDAMKVVQRRRGWLSDQDLRDIGELLGVSVDELDGIATFYNLLFRRPVGRHVIQVCDSVTCWIVGQEALKEAIVAHLGIGYGETTADGCFTLLPTPCLGLCDRAPAFLVDERIHAPATPASVPATLEQYR